MYSVFLLVSESVPWDLYVSNILLWLPSGPTMETWGPGSDGDMALTEHQDGKQVAGRLVYLQRWPSVLHPHPAFSKTGV